MKMERTEKCNRMVGKERYSVEDLQEIVEILRGEGGCPWDREQTHESIRNDLIEETYEVIEAIDTNQTELLREELGDLLFQILFHAQIEREKGNFVLDDIVSDISAKMIHRHPHVFGEVTVKDTGEVLSNWENIKTEEKQRNTLKDKLNAIPPMLPALMRGQKVVKKSGVYQDATSESLILKLKEQIATLDMKTDKLELSDALGSILLTLTAFAQNKGISAEQSFFEEINRFIDNF